MVTIDSHDSGKRTADRQTRTPVARDRRRAAAAEIVILLCVFVMSAVLMLVMTDGLQSVMYDSFRDISWALNILDGRVWSDPVLVEQPYWYAPGTPLLFAGIAQLGSTSVVDVYRSSALWWNALIPLLLYLAVRVSSDRLSAVLALPLVWLGSLWWMSHLAAPMPSIQGVVLGLAGLLCWQLCLREAQQTDGLIAAPALATGVVLAAATWYHPICALLAGGAIGLHALGLALWPRVGGPAFRTRVLLSAAMAGGISLLLALPLLIHLLSLPRQNPVPLSYFAKELGNPDFALQLHAPLVLVLAAIGVWPIARSGKGAGWVLGYLAVAALGQSPAYLERWLEIGLPYLLPHEFQWHGQLAVGICAAIGLVHLGRSLARRLPWPREPWVAHLLWIGGPLVAALAPAMPFLDVADAYMVDLRPVVETRREVVDWIQSSTPIEAVFACPPLDGYLTVAGLSGRKCVAVPLGHLNPAADGRRLLSELQTMLETDDEQEFLTLARQHQVSYLLMDGASPNGARRLSRILRWRSLTPVFDDQRYGALVFELRATEAGVGTR
jgi:hypothetical protein